MTEESVPETELTVTTSNDEIGIRIAENTTSVPETEALPSSTTTTKYAPQMGDKKDGYIWVDGFGWVVDYGGGVIHDVIGSDGDINKIVGIM